VNARTGGRTAAVGLVIAIALVVLAGAILVIGSESRMFSSKTRYTTNFRDVLGLRVGSPVYMSGVQVGSIESIELPTDPTRPGIPVGIAVDRHYAERVRAGTKASLAFLQILSGDKLVILSPGNPAEPPLPEGSVIPPNEPANLLESGANAAENISQITSKLNGILDTIDSGQGLVGKMLKDPKFGEEGLKNINDTFVEAKEVLKQIRDGQGLAGRLLFDHDYAQKMLDSLRVSLDRIGSLLQRVENNEGAIGSLLQKGGEGELMISELRGDARQMHELLEQVQHGHGLLSRLIYDEEFSRSVADDLKKSTASLSSILQKIDSGEGSLGALVNRPDVYQGLEDIVGGINKSRMGKAFLRHYQKKGASARVEGTGPDGDASRADPPAR
jgi:phospholipid/cholesterol/gamma-HCH transport system substrate-binding protein